jgi:hypothetical protein
MFAIKAMELIRKTKELTFDVGLFRETRDLDVHYAFLIRNFRAYPPGDSELLDQMREKIKDDFAIGRQK